MAPSKDLGFCKFIASQFNAFSFSTASRSWFEELTQSNGFSRILFPEMFSSGVLAALVQMFLSPVLLFTLEAHGHPLHKLVAGGEATGPQHESTVRGEANGHPLPKLVVFLVGWRFNFFLILLTLGRKYESELDF